MSTSTFVPRYVAAVHTCDVTISALHGRIAALQAQLREWEEKRELCIRLAEQNTGREP